MSSLTKLAQGQPCTIRLTGCDGGGATTVACHFRSVSLGAGVGHKPDDWLCAHACHSCHDTVDGRRKSSYSHDELRLAHAMGVFRTISWLIGHGVITIGKKRYSRMNIRRTFYCH